MTSQSPSPSSTPSTTIHTYSLTSPSSTTTIANALSLLRPHLPVSLPVYRRLQFGRFFQDTVLLTNVAADLARDATDANADPRARGGADGAEGPWIIAFVDRTCRPETEVWWFGSWEVAAAEGTGTQGEGVVEEILRNVFTVVRGLPLPESLHQDVLDAAAAEQKKQEEQDGTELQRDPAGISRTDYSAHMLNSNVVLCGAIHEASIPALEKTGLIQHFFGGPSHAQLVPNSTFVFDLDRQSPAIGKKLPAGLIWGLLKTDHFATVRARTQIPRQDKTLAVLPNLAIYEKDRPVAWAFVGLDGSLTTLHVEKEWRGKGLAKAIATKLFSEKMDFLWEKGVQRLAHGYVVQGNEQSSHLCRSIGGTSQWETYWVRVNLGTCD